MADSDSVAGSAIAKLDQVISSLLEQREQLVALSRAPAVPGESSLTPPSPFVRPLVGELDRIKPFQPFGTGFTVGFDKDSGAVVALKQKPKTDPFLSPPDCHYSLEVDVVDPGAAKWITLEWQIGRISVMEPSVLTLGLKACASRSETIRIELSLPRKGAPQKRVFLGTLELGKEFDFVSRTARVAREDLDGTELDKPATVMMFLPVAAFRLDLAFLRVFLSPAGT